MHHMILYVNGDSHSAGAEAVNSYCFAEDDWKYHQLRRQPHPDNLEVSYGNLLAKKLDYQLICDAESSSSIDRIIRTTQEYLSKNTPDVIIIGWPTFEREEWLHDGVYYQLTASGTDHLPNELKTKYKQWVIEQFAPELINQKLLSTHQKLYNFHCQLIDLKIKHLFFNTFSSFQNGANLQHLGFNTFEWDDSYADPYLNNRTFYHWLKDQGYKTVSASSYHFGADAHSAWAEFLYQNYVQRLLTR